MLNRGGGERLRMERDREVDGLRRKVDRGEEGLARRHRRVADEIKAGTAGDMNMLGLLAELPQAPRGVFIGREMQMRHLADRMTECVVERALGHVTAEHVRNRQPRNG